MEKNEKTLTPTEEFNQLFDSHNLLPKVVETLYGALKAKRDRWDKVQKRMITEDDKEIQVRAAELILAYRLGRPVRRVTRRAKAGGEKSE